MSELLLSSLSVKPLAALLLIPGISAIVLALLPGYRLTARLNVLAAGLTFLASLSLLVVRPEPGAYLLVDDLNVVFVVLGTFVGFTTSAFSASYIADDLGLWQKHGIKMKTVAITGIGAINSVISGSSHFAQASASSFGRATARGQKLIAIATPVAKLPITSR